MDIPIIPAIEGINGDLGFAEFDDKLRMVFPTTFPIADV
jgi:hypothetical protein